MCLISGFGLIDFLVGACFGFVGALCWCGFWRSVGPVGWLGGSWVGGFFCVVFG